MVLNIEYETKVLNINPQEITKKLRGLNAQETPEYLMKRVVFDIKSKDIEWVRLREQDNVTKMTYKYKSLDNIKVGKTKEIEVEVSDFDETKKLLEKLHFFYRILYQENKIHIFHLNDIEFSIATWPNLGPYLEIEAKSMEKVKMGLKMLGLVGKDSGDLDIAKIYATKNIDMNSIAELKF